MKKRAAVITVVMVLAALVSACKKGPSSEYETGDNFVVEPNGKGTARIVQYLDETKKPSLNIPPRIQKMRVTEIGPDSIADLWFTSVTIPDTVVTIMDFSFSGNYIREVTFPKKLTEIGNGAFMNNRLSSIIIPDSVKRIGYRAFCNNPLTSITIGGNVALEEISGIDSEQKEWKYTAFEGTGFEDGYNNNGKLAGTYTKVNGVWQFEPRSQGQ